MSARMPRLHDQMSKPRLTHTQRTLLAEIHEIAETAGVAYQQFLEAPDSEWRTVNLRLVREHLIRGEVITAYTLIDTLVESRLVHHLFIGGRHRLRAPRRSKRLRHFHYLLEEL